MRTTRWARGAKDLDLELLCVSQFTLYHTMKVNKRKPTMRKIAGQSQDCLLQGHKPDFHHAMGGEGSRELYDLLLTRYSTVTVHNTIPTKFTIIRSGQC